MSQSKPLSIINEGVLGPWAARKNPSDELDALITHAVYAQAVLDNASPLQGKNPPLDELLLRLHQLVCDADVVFDELDYFRVQDDLDGTSHAVDVAPKGCIDLLHFHARHAARAAAAKLKSSSSSRVGNECRVQDVKALNKPKFNRVVLSKKMTTIVERLKDVSTKVTAIIELHNMLTLIKA